MKQLATMLQIMQGQGLGFIEQALDKCHVGQSRLEAGHERRSEACQERSSE